MLLNFPRLRICGRPVRRRFTRHLPACVVAVAVWAVAVCLHAVLSLFLKPCAPCMLAPVIAQVSATPLSHTLRGAFLRATASHRRRRLEKVTVP